MDHKTTGPGWDRAQLTLRLPPARLARLRALADQMEPGATPTDAVILAIDAATGLIGAQPDAARFDALEEAMEALSADRQRDTEKIAAAIVALAKELRDLRALISEVAAEDPDGF
jgi:hypothetical protein